MDLTISFTDAQKIISMCSNKEYAVALFTGTAKEWIDYNYPSIGEILLDEELDEIMVISIHPEEHSIVCSKEIIRYIGVDGSEVSEEEYSVSGGIAEKELQERTYSGSKLDYLLASQSHRKFRAVQISMLPPELMDKLREAFMDLNHSAEKDMKKPDDAEKEPKQKKEKNPSPTGDSTSAQA